MQLTDEQKAKVREWIHSGSKLSEIQDSLRKEFDLHLLYMDVRLLVDDLQLTPKETMEPEPVKPPAADEPPAEEFGTGEPLSPMPPSRTRSPRRRRARVEKSRSPWIRSRALAPW